MIISDKGNFIFVHVQKTAGLSIEAVLTSGFPDAEKRYGRHSHASTGIRALGRSHWNEYFSFAFVRNPWNRLVSWYVMIEQEKAQLSSVERKLERPFEVEIWNYTLRCSHDFESFLYDCTGVVIDQGYEKSFAFNQVDYLVDENGEIAVDFVGRFETLEADFNHVAHSLGLKSVHLSRRNQSRHGHYSHWYSSTTRDLVAERYAKDIEAFGYRFEVC